MRPRALIRRHSEPDCAPLSCVVSPRPARLPCRASDISREAKRSTVTGQDVLNALKASERPPSPAGSAAWRERGPPRLPPTPTSPHPLAQELEFDDLVEQLEVCLAAFREADKARTLAQRAKRAKTSGAAGRPPPPEGEEEEEESWRGHAGCRRRGGGGGGRRCRGGGRWRGRRGGGGGRAGGGRRAGAGGEEPRRAVRIQ